MENCTSENMHATPADLNNSSKSKRPQKSREIDIKLMALKYLNMGMTKAAVSRKLGVAESTLRGWWKDPKLRVTMTDLPEGSSSRSPSPIVLSGSSSPVNCSPSSSPVECRTSEPNVDFSAKSTLFQNTRGESPFDYSTLCYQYASGASPSFVHSYYNSLTKAAAAYKATTSSGKQDTLSVISISSDECTEKAESESADSGRGSASPKAESLFGNLDDVLREKCNAVIESNGGTQEIIAAAKELGMTWFSDLLEEVEADEH